MRRAVTPALLLVGLALVCPLAAAGLSDLPWITGVYDDADHDALVALLGDGGSPTASFGLGGAIPLTGRWWLEAFQPTGAHPSPPRSPRAPPPARSLAPVPS